MELDIRYKIRIVTRVTSGKYYKKKEKVMSMVRP